MINNQLKYILPQPRRGDKLSIYNKNLFEYTPEGKGIIVYD